MILEFILASTLCPPTKVLNTTDIWNKEDTIQLKFSSNRCKHIYKDSPCLKYFWKVETRVYRAICGKNYE